MSGGQFRRQQTQDPAERTIARLDDQYGLNLLHDVCIVFGSGLSGRAPTAEEEQAHAIYQRIQELHVNQQQLLSFLLGRFAKDAHALSSPSVNGQGLDGAAITAPLSVGSLEERAVFRQCLYDVLFAAVDDRSPRAAKRVSDDGHPTVRRTRSRHDTHGHSFGAVDSIPVRSTTRASPFGRPNQEFTDAYPRAGPTSFIYSSLNTSSTSLASRVFSVNENDSFRTDISDFSSQCHQPQPQVLPDVYGPQAATVTETGMLERDLCAAGLGDEFEVVSGPNEIQRDMDVDTCRETSGGSSRVRTDTLTQQSVQSALLHLNLDTPTPFRTAKLTDLPNKRLGSIWPAVPSGLIEAPLAVIWEVTRIAQHCGVGPQCFDVKYEAQDDWREQSRLRNKVAAHKDFVGKGLPNKNNQSAWDAALGSFQRQDNVVVLTAELEYQKRSNGTQFQLKLQPLKLSMGHRLERRFGADRFLEVLLPSPTAKDAPEKPSDILDWLCQEHYFLGRFWVPYFTRSIKKTVKDASNGRDPPKTRDVYLQQVYFFATNGNSFRNPDFPGSIPPAAEAQTPNRRTKLSLSGLLRWAIGLQPETSQPIPKLFSRIALSLSRTIPAIELEKDQIIHQLHDIQSATDSDGRCSIMNDGIGQMSFGLAKNIATRLGLLDIPSAFQGRLGSAKGMWIIKVDDEKLQDEIWIETYPSQRKWDCDFDDVHHRTLELKSWSRELRPATLNQQFIPILEFQSTDPQLTRQAIADHLYNKLKEDLEAVMSVLKHPQDLRSWMRQSGGPPSDRIAHGYSRFLGGLPDREEDKIAAFLDSGFDPQNMAYLIELIWKVLETKATLLKGKMNYPIPCSTNALMVADFSGVLEEGEVHMSFSTKFQVEGFSDTMLEGRDILVARSPAHFPSDIQKVRVVSKPELRGLKDVIVFPTKGARPLADLLSGGDYDGDRAWVCWDRDIVRNFQNADAPLKYDFHGEGYFTKFEGTFNSLFEAQPDLEVASWDFLRRGMDFHMQRSLLGWCTKYKERHCYHNKDALASEKTGLLCQLLSDLVDQGKAGITFSEDDWARFREVRLQGHRFYTLPEYENEKPQEPRKMRERNHVLDFLKYDVAHKAIEEMLTQFYQALNASEAVHYDRELTRPFNDVDASGQSSTSIRKMLIRLKEDIRKLEDQWKENVSSKPGQGDFNAKVDAIYRQWQDIRPLEEGLPPEASTLLKAKWGTSRSYDETWGKDSDAIDTNADWSLQLSPWAILKASATFYHCHKASPKFAWFMAGRQLMVIKATVNADSTTNADSCLIPVVPFMWAILKPDKKMTTAMAARRGDDNESVAALEAVTEFDDLGVLIDDL